MAEKNFQLEILTPKQKVFVGPVTSLTARAAQGYLGILANHAPLVATLAPGRVIFHDPAGHTHTLESSGSGILEVHHNRVTLLADELLA